MTSSSRTGAGALLLLAAGLHAGEPQRLAVTQARARLPAITVYLDVLDEAGRPAQPEITELQATLGAALAHIEVLQPFAASGEGVAYIFLVDVSRSQSEAEFAQLRAALTAWTAELQPKDRVALLSFGDDVRVELDYSADGAAFAATLKGLAPRARTTKLYAALQTALELGRREDPQLPERRVLVVLSGGRDEGSGRSLESTLQELSEEHLPLYAIGQSRLAEPERKRALAVLSRLAATSGGLYREAGREPLGPAFAELKTAIRRVFQARFRCEPCRIEGQSAHLQVSLGSSPGALTEGLELRLLPALKKPAPSPRPATRPTSAPAAPASRSSATWLAALVALVLVGIVFLLIQRRVARKAVPGGVR